MMKTEVQEGVLKTMILGWNFDAKTGGLEMQKQACRIIRMAKYKVSVFREKASTIKRGPQMSSKSSYGHSGVRFLSVGSLFERTDFLCIFDLQKI